VLAPILIALDLIAMDCPDAHEREHGIIARQVRLLVSLVDELLDSSRIRSGKVTLERRSIELADVVQRAVEVARPVIAAHHHSLTIDVAGRGLPIEGDELRLAQVVSNLLTNAAKFTAAGGAITVTGERCEGLIVLRVRDSGIGISKHMLQRVFDPYVQVRGASTRPHSGLGLGLAIVRSLVTMHGGTVTAHSPGLDRGSEFVVELPAAAPASDAVATGANASATAAGRAHKILIVDDNCDAVTLTANAMTRLGYDVRVAFDGPSALVIAEEFEPELVVLDIEMPGMSGYEVGRRLKSMFATSGVDLIALTGHGQAVDRKCSREAGFGLHLVKPVDVATLQRGIDDVWRRSQS
jgi:CheY-like chemotaxis protein/two-component sensor histidine kinase